MKEIRGQKRGVKLEPQLSKAESIQKMDVELKNLQMAGQVTQMMVKNLMTNLQNMSKDLGKAFNIINELQYKILAMQGVGNFDMAALNAKADELRLNDFIEASDAEDVSGGFTVGDKVEDSSVVILTSTTQAAEGGLFRSRIKLAECGVPALIEGLKGQPVGTKVKCVLNGTEHEVELLGIRNPPSPVQVVEVVPEGEETVH